MSRQLPRLVRRPAGAAGLLAAGLLLAACGGGSGDGGTGGSRDVRTGATAYGTALVDAAGRTLYVFAADSPRTSTCTGSCLQSWPAAEVNGTVSHSSDVTADLGTITRDDGTTQLTVDGWPAYTYAADTGPGDATGQGKDLSGGLWWVLEPDGSQNTSTEESGAGSDPGVGGGY